MKSTNTQKVVYIGLLTALHILLKQFLTINTPIARIGFGFVPLVVVAILFGPLAAMISGAIGDLIAAFLIASGPFFPGFTLSAILTGLLYGLFLYQKPRSPWRILTSVLLVTVFISLGLNTIWLHMITGKGVLALLPSRVMQNLIMIPVQFFTIWAVVYRILPFAPNNLWPDNGSR